MLASAMQTLVQLVYPPRCLSCGGQVESDFGLCGSCWGETPFVVGLSCDHCGTPLPGSEDEDDAVHCDECRATPRPWAQGRAATVYAGKARGLVLALKHGDRQDIARPAAGWMARVSKPLLRKDMLVVPVPLHLHRHIGRRYNQAALLAEALAEEFGLDWCPDLLQRRASTPPLDGKTRDERFETLFDMMTVPTWRSDLIEGRPVLLVDDVMTSGATLSAAAEACLAAGASEVCVSVLARVAKEA